MNQSIVAGIGNYIKSDSLWLAKINPHRVISSISDGELAILNRSIKKVIKESYASGGSTLNSYSGLKKEKLDPSRRRLVYMQNLDPNEKEVIKEETADKRSTFWVPEVQK